MAGMDSTAKPMNQEFLRTFQHSGLSFGALSPSEAPSLETAVGSSQEMFITQNHISGMEEALDHRSLRDLVLWELRKWKLEALEQNGLEQERRKALEAQDLVHAQSLRELLETTRRVGREKSQVIERMTSWLIRQKEQTDIARLYGVWRQRYLESKKESKELQVAKRHHHRRLQRRVWAAWLAVVHAKLKRKIEHKNDERLEQLCLQLEDQFEARRIKAVATVEDSEVVAKTLHNEGQRHEEDVKKAFLRGVCALNKETLGMFHPDEEEGRILSQCPPQKTNQVRKAEPVNVLSDGHQFGMLKIAPQSSEVGGRSSVQFNDERRSTTQMTSLLSPLTKRFSRQTTSCPCNLPVTAATSAVTCSRPPGGAMASPRQPRTFNQRSARRTEYPNSMTRVTDNRRASVAGPSTNARLVERHCPVTTMTVKLAPVSGLSAGLSWRSSYNVGTLLPSPRIFTVKARDKRV